jgi:hypothetical protein
MVWPDRGGAAAPPAVPGKPTAASFGPVGALTPYGETGTVYLTAGTHQGFDFGTSEVIASEPGVTVVNCKANAFTTYYGAFWLENTISYGIYVDSYYAAIDGVTLKNNRVIGGAGDGMDIFSGDGKVISNVLIDGYYAAGFDYASDPTSHGDGIQIRGATGLTLRNATIDMGPWQTFDGYAPKNAAVYIENVNSLTDVLIEDVWLNGGGYTFYAAEGTSNCRANRMRVDGTDYGYAPYSITGAGGGWTFTDCTRPDGNPL